MNIVSFDPTKPVRTRADMPATINRTDLKNKRYPIGATYFDQIGEEIMSVFTANGSFASDEVPHPNDLINTGSRFKASGVINVFADGKIYAFPNADAAKAQQGLRAGFLACVPVNIDLPI